jgi:hypothetical protein
LLDARDTDLEKLVEVRAEDRKKLYPLDQRLGCVLRFLQNAPIKFEPAEFAVNEILRIPKAFVRRLRDLRLGFRRNNCAVLFLFRLGLSLRHSP